MELANLPETCQLLRPALLNVIDLLKQLEAVGDALKELTASCERKLKALKWTLQPSFLHCGIQMLPDDVLMHVFDIIMEQPDHNSKEIFRLSHVSSRFRSLALARPQLWSRVSLDMPLNAVKTCLEHSKQSFLTVNISTSTFTQFEIGKARTILGLVVRHSSRWQAFSFSCVQPRERRTESPLHLSQLMGNCNVSNLEALGLKCCRRESCGLCRAMEVLHTQEMPKLHSIYIRGISLSPTSASRPLTSTRIRHLKLFSPAEWDIRTLANVLAPLVDLVELVLSDFRSDEMTSLIIQGADITLPNLKRLRLFGLDLVSFSVWTRHCRTPRVEQLELHVGVEPVKEWLTAIPSGSFGSVKKLYFERNIYLPNDGVVDFWHLVSKFPGLEHLDLCAQSCTFDSNLRHELSMNKPPLRSLSLKLVVPVVELSYFVDTLKDNGCWKQFRSYEMKRPAWATKEETERILAGKEVKWQA